jgi:hypothetical protein
MDRDRRRHPRYDIAAQIRVRYGRVNYVMEVGNISLSGAFVRCDDLERLPQFRIGQELDLDVFEFENLDNVSLRGRIVRIVESGGALRPGFGVQFVNPTPETYDKLFGLVECACRLSAEPPPLPGQGSDKEGAR